MHSVWIELPWWDSRVLLMYCHDWNPSLRNWCWAGPKCLRQLKKRCLCFHGADQAAVFYSFIILPNSLSFCLSLPVHDSGVYIAQLVVLSRVLWAWPSRPVKWMSTGWTTGFTSQREQNCAIKQCINCNVGQVWV